MILGWQALKALKTGKRYKVSIVCKAVLTFFFLKIYENCLISSLFYYSQLFATFVGLINVELRQADKALCLLVLRKNRDEKLRYTDVFWVSREFM